MTDNPCRKQSGRGFGGGKREAQNINFTKPVVSARHGSIGIRCRVEKSRTQHLSVGQRDSQDRSKQFCFVLALRMKRIQQIVSDRAVKKMFESGIDEGWSEFNRRYPKHHGFLTVSRVGFSRDRQQALPYIGNQWTEAAGEGYLVLLHKQNGSWKEVARASCWIS